MHELGWSGPALVVSCQAEEGTPLDDGSVMARIAAAAMLGGAAALRINGPEQVMAVRAALPDVPIIGIWKIDIARTPIRITPTFAAALALVEAGSTVVAVDATLRDRSGLPTVAELIRDIRSLGVEVLADIDTVSAAEAALAAGACAVATTLAGYTNARPRSSGPDLDLVTELSQLGATVVAEGRFSTAADVRHAVDRGAHTVVVGKAITDPIFLTQRLRAAIW